MSTISKENATTLHFEATELRLGLPGFDSFQQGSSNQCVKLDEKPLFPLHPLRVTSLPYDQKNYLSGSKRGFADAVIGFEGSIYSHLDDEVIISSQPSSKRGVNSGSLKEKSVCHMDLMRDLVLSTCVSAKTDMKNRAAPATKVQVMGWPPITTSRRNSLNAPSKDTCGTHGKRGSSALFVKVGMDGAPYLRKVNLNSYTTYRELSFTLEKLFSGFTIGQHGPDHMAYIKDISSESVLTDQLHLSEYVLTYEDKDGDWMLVGDVPWEMFSNNCKRLRIMKVSDAIGLGIVQNSRTEFLQFELNQKIIEHQGP